MHKSLQSLYPDPELFLALPSNELADLILLELWGSNQKLSRHNFSNDAVSGYSGKYHEAITRAVLEAWSWLVTQQMIAETQEAGWFFLTRTGEERRQRLTELASLTADEGMSRDEATTSVPKESEDESLPLGEPVIRDETIFASTVGDQPARKDSLGFEPYVKAVADFLTNELTVPPLTLSVEGDWGSGKSSFMTQLHDLLQKHGSLTLQFNAWRHDKHEELWAAFALEFIRQISSKQKFWRRWWANFALRRRRFDWAEGWLDLIRASATWVGIFAAVIGLPVLLILKGDDWIIRLNRSISDGTVIGNLASWIVGLSGFSVAIVALASVLLQVKKYIGNPLAIDLKKHLKSPKYEDRVAFVESFHRDLNHIVRSYVGKKKVFVFIDDLDRCEAPKAAELMQAINLMIANDPQLIFIVGMDREKIAAGIASKQEKLLPYLVGAEEGEDRATPLTAIEYGYRFIEKFIQVPFAIPSPTDEEFKRFIEELSFEIPKVGNDRPKWWRKFTLSSARKQMSASAMTSPLPPQSATLLPSRQQVTRRLRMTNLISGEAETGTVRDIVLRAARLLGRNPRRLKQFLNLFRLKAHIASETGLFDLVEGANPMRTLTLEQLGKFVAVTLMHPRLQVDLHKDSALLAKLQYRADNIALPVELESTKSLEYWEKNSMLMEFLRDGVTLYKHDRYSLIGLNAEALLQISPRVQSSTLADHTRDQLEDTASTGDQVGLQHETVSALKVITERTFRQLPISQDFKPRLTLFVIDNLVSPARLVQIARYSWAGNAPGGFSMSINQGIAGKSVREVSSVRIDNIRLASKSLGFTDEEAKQLNPEITSVACVPIVGSKAKPLGVLALDVIAPKVLEVEHVQFLEKSTPRFAFFLEAV